MEEMSILANTIREYEDEQKKKAEQAARKKKDEESEQKKKSEQAARKKKDEENELKRHNTAMKTGAAVGGGLGLVGGAAVGYFCFEATLKGAAIGGFAGAIVGAAIGFGYCWFWR
jgi:uncharacterized membrane protein